MSDPRLIVLKFGGSVLHDETDLCRAVHEIYRWRREGWQVLAVVSALAGHTDALWQRCKTVCDDANPSTLAARIVLGEIECASELVLHLDRAGVPASLLTPGGMQLSAAGQPLDARPVSVRTQSLRSALRRDGVLVVPGFAALDQNGRTVVLGRGGSDLTALFLAQQLNADHCRLIKDVDGLYGSDPSCADPPPQRFHHATYGDALATNGSIIQPKAVAYAQRCRQPFELAAHNAIAPTLIGASSSRFARAADRPAPLRTVLLGLGTVGAGVYRLLSQCPELFEITHVVVRDVDKPRDMPIDRSLLSTDVQAAVTFGADLVIELIGGADVAFDAQRSALLHDAHVISANKALIAQSGPELRALASGRGVQLRYSASVAGSIPLLEHLARANVCPVLVRGILNGTANYVLNRLALGDDLDTAVHEAHRLGFAEADPARDLTGRDAADKLRVIGQAMGVKVRQADHIDVEPLTRSVEQRAVRAARCGRRIRQVAQIEQRVDRLHSSVSLVECGPDDVLFDVPGAHNAVELHWADGRRTLLRGRGAGRWPTAESVMGDALAVARSEASRSPQFASVQVDVAGLAMLQQVMTGVRQCPDSGTAPAGHRVDDHCCMLDNVIPMRQPPFSSG